MKKGPQNFKYILFLGATKSQRTIASRFTNSMAEKSRRHIPWRLYIWRVPMNGISAILVPWNLRQESKYLDVYSHLFTLTREIHSIVDKDYE